MHTLKYVVPMRHRHTREKTPKLSRQTHTCDRQTPRIHSCTHGPYTENQTQPPTQAHGRIPPQHQMHQDIHSERHTPRDRPQETGKGSSPHSVRGTVASRQTPPSQNADTPSPETLKVASDGHVQANTQAHTKTGCADTFSQCDPF